MSNAEQSPTQPAGPDWNTPKPDVLVRPTWSPAALAMGITLIGWGLITSFIVLAMGLAIFVFALATWIKEICNERRSD